MATYQSLLGLSIVEWTELKIDEDCFTSVNRVSESERPGVWTEADQCGVIQLHVGPQTFVFPVQEVLGAPDPDGAVISTGCKVFPVTAEIEARHISTVALKSMKTSMLTKKRKMQRKYKHTVVFSPSFFNYFKCNKEIFRACLDVLYIINSHPHRDGLEFACKYTWWTIL